VFPANGGACQNLDGLGVRAKPPCEFTPRDRRGVWVSILALAKGHGQSGAQSALDTSPSKKELGRWRNSSPPYFY
jgi:hypothetical protein